MDHFSIVIPQESQYEAVLEFLAQDYIQRERLCVTSGLASEIKKKENNFEDILSVLQKSLTLIAIDERDNSVAGICINVAVEDMIDISYEDLSDPVASKIQVIATFTATLEKGNRPSEVNNTATRGFCLWMLGVRQIHCGKGLARKLSEKTLELAQQQGFTYVESLASCPETRNLFGSMGFEVKSKMRFQDFIIEDNKPGFPYATPEDFAEFTVKIL